MSIGRFVEASCRLGVHEFVVSERRLNEIAKDIEAAAVDREHLDFDGPIISERHEDCLMLTLDNGAKFVIRKKK